MPSAAEIDYLLQATRSSVKRFGGEQPSLSHLAQILSTKWDEEFAQIFGDDGSERVALLLKERRYIGDESDVTVVLKAGDDRQAILHELNSRLREAIAEASGAVSTESETPPASAESDGDSDAAESATESGWPARTQRFVQPVCPQENLVDREDAVTHVVSTLGRTRHRVPIIVGARGSGRTALMGAVAAKLPAPDGGATWRVDPAALGPEPEDALFRVIDDCEPHHTLFIDDVDKIASLSSSHPNVMVLRIIRAAAMKQDLSLVLSCEARYFQRLKVVAGDLTEDLIPVRLPPLSESSLRDVVGRTRPALESEHGVAISPALLTLACLPSNPADVSEHPGLALDRLDAAASRAAVLGDAEADIEHLAGSTSLVKATLRADELREQLSASVRGQQHAVNSVAARLALTLARLDLYPGRPDGVFLFVGPTGVGKTKMAGALSKCLFGGEARLIRLDMSEYSHDWAVSRLVGPMPGYVGSTEPDNWLTTKVTNAPDSVILLDEIEKAHPAVWNTFLQVFDAGRLTDSRGVTADFSNTIIVMTSNLGAAAASGPGLGFAAASADVDRARQKITSAVKEAMAPELINRIDELVVFDPLPLEAIEEIAAQELTLVTERLAENGWSVGYDPEVVRHLAESGYDPAYGARHLQRNIERRFLSLIAESSGKSVHVAVCGDELSARDA